MASAYRKKRASHRIRAIFYAEFDNTVGPKVFYQAPPDYIAPDDFDEVSDYIITRPDLCGRVISVVHSSFRCNDVEDSGDDAAEFGDAYTDAVSSPTAAYASVAQTAPMPGDAAYAGAKILNFPVGLQHEKYPRNTLLFSVGFVLDADADTRPYEAVLKKLGLLLYSMEIESEFLFKGERKSRLADILPIILHGLNSRGECFVAVDSCDTIALKLFPVLPEPPRVRDHDVPVRIRDLDVLVGSGDDSGWDLCMRMILPHIDGKNYARSIAELADVEPDLVKKGLQQLLYYGCITLVDIFQYSNIYATQPRVQLLLRSPDLRDACMRYIQREEYGFTLSSGSATTEAAPLPMAPASSSSLTFDRVFRLYTAFGAGSRTCDVCAQGDTYGHGIDDRKFITFGVMHGLLRRIHKYAVPAAQHHATAAEHMPVDNSKSPTAQMKPADWALLDGSRTVEEICCKLKCPQAQLEAEIEGRGGYVYVLK